MPTTRILIIDDEVNIRAMLAEALGDLGRVDTAMDGEEALRRMEQDDYDLAFLDLKMPGMGGLEVLRRTAEHRPDIRFVVITAHGDVESAVEAIKLGAVDFLRKPFTLEEVRGLTRKIVEEDVPARFEVLIDRARQAVRDGHHQAARAFLGRAAALEPRRPEVFNLLGAVAEKQGDYEEARKNYHSAYWIDPTYAPARNNLERFTEQGRRPPLDLGGES